MRSWQGCGASGMLIHCWWECKMVNYFKKQQTTLKNSNSCPTYLHKRNDNYAQKKTDLYQNNHSSFIHNSQKLKTAQVFLNRKMDAQIVAYSYNRGVINNKKERTTDTHNNLDESQVSY